MRGWHGKLAAATATARWARRQLSRRHFNTDAVVDSVRNGIRSVDEVRKEHGT